MEYELRRMNERVKKEVEEEGGRRRRNEGRKERK